MAYRNGTYVAFAAGGTSDFTSPQSDIRWFNLLKAWKENNNIDFNFINSHDKTCQVRDTSCDETLKARLTERLRNSKNMLLILSHNTKKDTDWVPFEIEYAVDVCKIPIIVAYTDVCEKKQVSDRSDLYPNPLLDRIKNNTAYTIRIPFHKDIIKMAISQFTPDNLPKGSNSYYIDSVYSG